MCHHVIQTEIKGDSMSSVVHEYIVGPIIPRAILSSSPIKIDGVGSELMFSSAQGENDATFCVKAFIPVQKFLSAVATSVVRQFCN